MSKEKEIEELLWLITRNIQTPIFDILLNKGVCIRFYKNELWKYLHGSFPYSYSELFEDNPNLKFRLEEVIYANL